jgi:hypothetical protein
VVERQLPKLYVVGSIPIARSNILIADVARETDAVRCAGVDLDRGAAVANDDRLA